MLTIRTFFNRYFLKLFFITIFLLIGESYAYNYLSPVFRLETLTISPGDSIRVLQESNLIRNSAEVSKDTLLLKPGVDYIINYRTSEIRFMHIRRKTTLQVEYQIVPENILKKFSLFKVVDFSDSAAITRIKKNRIEWFDSGSLTITGSKTFAISVGNNDDLSIDQSLFLQLDGEISKNANIQAQISDSHSPVTPEGDSREISSLDKIFIRIYGDQYEISFGTLEMQLSGSNFLNYTPHFEGVKLQWKGKHIYKGAIAISRGKRITSRFFGSDGKQGPYYVTGNSSESLMIVPGTEEVYLNGIILNRGDDYSIDYSEGTLTFNNASISSNSSIIVSYQYSDENYRQNLYLGGTEFNITDKMFFKQYAFIQVDDKKNPLTEEFSEDDKDILRNSGDSAVLGNGVFETVPGEGNYIWNSDGYYEYAASDSTGNYKLYFTYVGINNGDYERDSFSKYIYVGSNEGDWIIARKLIPPQSKQNYDFSCGYKSDFFSLFLESLLTNYDKNTYSESDDDDNFGIATHSEVNVKLSWDKINPTLRLYNRYLSKHLTPVAEINNYVDMYEFSTFYEPDTLSKNEYYLEGSLNLEDIFIPQISIMRREVSEFSTQNRLSFNNKLMQYKYMPSITQKSTFAKLKFLNESKSSNLSNHKIKISYSFWKLTPGLEYYYRQIRDNYPDSTNIGSRLTEETLFAESYKTEKIAFRISYGKAINGSYLESWNKTKNSIIKKCSCLLNTDNHSIRFDYTRTDVDEYIPQTIKSNYDHLDAFINNMFFNKVVKLSLIYRIQNIETYPKVRELQYVGENVGMYDSTGVFTENGDWDWVTINKGDPVMTVENNTDLSLFLTPVYLFPNEENFLKQIQSETRINFTENSSNPEKWKIYFYLPDEVMNDMTIYGSRNIRQSIWYTIIKRKLLSEFSYEYQKTLDNRYQTKDENRRKEYEVMSRYTSDHGYNFESVLTLANEDNSYYLTESDMKRFEISGWKSLNSNLNMKVESGYSQEKTIKRTTDESYKLFRINLGGSLTLFFKNNYRTFFRLDYLSNTRKGSDLLSFLDEKRAGNIFKWQIQVNYQVSKYITALFDYQGNDYPEKETEHKMRMEISAEF